MDGILSPTRLLIVGFIALLVFGPKRLPELGRALGSTMREFRHGVREAHEQVTAEDGSSATQNAEAQPLPAAAEASLLPAQGATVLAPTEGRPATRPAIEVPSVQAAAQGPPAPAGDAGSGAVGKD